MFAASWNIFSPKGVPLKKKTVLRFGIMLLLLISFWVYRQTIGAPVIGTVTGPEWEHLTVNEVNYERDGHAPVNGTERDRFIGIAQNGETRFRIYSIRETDDYLLCMCEWEGYIFKRVQ